MQTNLILEHIGYVKSDAVTDNFTLLCLKPGYNFGCWCHVCGDCHWYSCGSSWVHMTG